MESKICQDSLIWPAEGVFISWLQASTLATTIALVFYHMTNVGSLPNVNRKLAGITSSGLILSGLIYSTAAVVPYNMRITKCHKSDAENIFRWIDTFAGVFTIILQCIIAGLIIKDSMK